MRFSLEQSLPGRFEAIVDALLDPQFIRCLGDLPNLEHPEVLDQRRDGDVVVQRIHYRFTGRLSAAVTRVIDPEKIAWVDETTYDLAARRATFRIHPDHYANKLRCAGTHTFTERDAVTARRIDGELSVSFPLVGRAVERTIMKGLEEHLAAEAALLAEWVEDKG